eukprot:GHRQ01004502.1.p2 GENE.GHRQ01004502.1~~GHRQ01004502.1.p2  ORF type:complete len:104 (-),score=15.24 GHRQ01004502.1:626-937(-)
MPQTATTQSHPPMMLGQPPSTAYKSRLASPMPYAGSKAAAFCTHSETQDPPVPPFALPSGRTGNVCQPCCLFSARPQSCRWQLCTVSSADVLLCWQCAIAQGF